MTTTTTWPGEPLSSRAERLALVAEAGRAPSAHNTQPWRWRIEPAGKVTLLEDRTRRLDAGDPTARDHLVGLGAAWEALAVAAARRGLALSAPQAAGAVHEDTALRPVALGTLTEGPVDATAADALAARRTWRGRFPRSGEDTVRRVRALVGERDGVTALADPWDIARLARLHDRLTLRSLAEPAVLEELRRWMRLDGVPARDGLTADCLGLPRRLAPLAGALLGRRAFGALRRLGLAAAVVGEAAAVRSATALLVVHAPARAWRLDWGRHFLGVWLDVTRAGLCACPMSALVDHEDGVGALRSLTGLGPERALVNVLRVGPPPGPLPASPRLDARRLLVAS